MAGASYDRLGRGYAARRATDPRIAAAIEAALGDARSVVNVGAGTGSYEPTGREVVAVEPSAVMIAQRLPGSPPAIQAAAEALPLADGSVDAAMAIFTDHHWSDRAAGIQELRRVARKRVVMLNVDPAWTERFWLTRDYLRSFIDLVPEPSGARLLGERAARPARRRRDHARPRAPRLPRRLLPGLLATPRGLPGRGRPQQHLRLPRTARRRGHRGGGAAARGPRRRDLGGEERG